MSTIRGGVEQSRERLVALVLLLQRAWHYGPLTQEEILNDLTVDEFPRSAKGPKKVRAYEGSSGTVRQKFERDKVRIRELGFDIETVERGEGAVGYRINPDSGYAPKIYFTPEEERVVRIALRLCGFGASGAFTVFNDVPASDGSLEISNYFTPVLRALHLRRAISFDYYSLSEGRRDVEPLVVDVFQGVTYLVARVVGSADIKGYRFTRMTSMPVVKPDRYEVDDETTARARAWRPEYTRAPELLEVVASTNVDYGELLAREYPRASRTVLGDNRVEVRISFESPRAALRFVLDCADRVRLLSPQSLRDELAVWLESVNRGVVPELDQIRFDPAPSPDVLGQTLQLLHAVYATEDGLRVSELAHRFSLAPDHVRLIMDRLVSLEPMANVTDGTSRFPAHVIKECDDWDDEAHDDSTYRADFSDLPSGSDDLSPLMWRDLFELNIALREASRIYSDPSILSAIDKIEATTHASVQVQMTNSETLLGEIRGAVDRGERVTILYTSGTDGAPRERTVEPRELRILNGHTYFRAFCTARDDWRTFRVDRVNAVLAVTGADVERPRDVVDHWLTQVGEEGIDVVVAVESSSRWIFEPLPGATWCTLADGRHAVRFRLSDEAFLDHLMLRAGAGAVVVTPQYATAGHELARRIGATN